MHAECVKRGLYIYLEKPPTLSHEELLTMLDVEAGAQHTTHVGFNFVVEAQRQALKERLLGGEFGAVREAYMRSLQPRASRDRSPRSRLPYRATSSPENDHASALPGLPPEAVSAHSTAGRVHDRATAYSGTHLECP